MVDQKVSSNFDVEREIAERATTDWQFGAFSAPSLVSIPLEERGQYLPLGETQFDPFADFTDCASRSPVNHLEALFTYHFLHEMKPENKQWLVANGYIQDSKVTFSDRFIAILSGTTHSGNSLKSPLDTIRKQGLIPKKLLPKEDWMKWEDYYDSSKITPELKTLGQEFLKRFALNYEQVNHVQFGDLLKDDMIGVAGHAWSDPVNGVYQEDNGPFNHAFLLYDLPRFQAFDNYVPFDKNLSPSFKFFDYGYRIYIASEQVPQESTIGLLQHLADLLKQLVAFLITQSPPPQPIPSPMPTPMPSIPKKVSLDNFCMAIRDFEGYVTNPPSRSFRNCNPGNVRYSTVGYASIYGHVGKDDKGFAIFKDYPTGWLYLKNLVLSKVRTNPEQTIHDFMYVYAPPSENITETYIAFITKRLGVEAGYPMKLIT